MFEIIETFFPVLVLFLLLRGILQTILRSGRRRQQSENDDDYGEDEETGEQENAPQPEAGKQPDLAAEFERRLKKASADSAGAKEQAQPVRTDRQRVHRDDEAQHEGKGRIHKENEAFKHDKGKVYYDPKGDYSYNEELPNAKAAALRARYAAGQEEARKPRLKLKHGALVQGFIMSQVLEKPRSIKPYCTDELP